MDGLVDSVLLVLVGQLVFFDSTQLCAVTPVILHGVVSPELRTQRRMLLHFIGGSVSWETRQKSTMVERVVPGYAGKM